MIACPRCQTIQPVSVVNSGLLNECPGCDTELRVEVFNAYFTQEMKEVVGHDVLVQGQAECFYHPGKQAVVDCESCGRLLCALCEVEMEGKHLCMSCLQTGRDKKKMSRLENERTLYDRIALALAVYPLLFVFITLLTAPVAIYVALRYWNSPNTLLPHTQIRNVFALTLAGLQLAVWVLIFIGLLA